MKLIEEQRYAQSIAIPRLPEKITKYPQTPPTMMIPREIAL
jgi:hypothetical protein